MSGLSSIEQAAIEHVAHAPMLARTEAWTAINSGTRNLAGLAAMADALAQAFAILPGHLALVDPAPVESVTPDGRVEQIAHGRHLHLAVRPEAPVQMLLTGHMDTVFAADHPFQTGSWRDDGALNAPGAADMKGGLALMLAALEAVEASPLAGRLGYEVVINSDEETGSFASRGLIEGAARGKAAALTYEPALPDGTLAGARGGTGNFSLIVRGRSAHAGRNPEEGRNALVAAAALAVRLAEARAPGLAVNPARIDGGGPNNVVPDLAILRVNFRPRDEWSISIAKAAIERAAHDVMASHDVRVEVHGSFNRPPKPLDPGAERLFELVRSAGADLGIPVAWQATGGVCDGNNIAACGVPVVDTMGARGGAIHSAEEFLIPESLPERAALSALTILRIAERGRP
ncbi:glutamate carboxypeptidase [Sphingomonas naasensis]|uniref:Hydrolase n=1 Tax=Sphingomonas naasensis TaxID=1344951 RepID=A0A4S1WQS1_9SPHN|nr:hydrolase [Sphingomonas naasensis]NIJ18444.1 glutamate carboxypeptidase [Sphingomonas naasensis]TGX45708.1 hydrolase [Sphingomonas naasensis]